MTSSYDSANKMQDGAGSTQESYHISKTQSAYDDDGDSRVPSPIGDLSAYRAGMDTPKQALTNGFGIFNQITSVLVNFFVNVGAMYGGAYPHDWVGVWRTPPTPNPYGLQMWSDFLMTSILVVAGMGLLATPGQWASIWVGQARPIPGKYVAGRGAHWMWKYSLGAHWPGGAKNFLFRTLLLVLQFSSVWYGVTMLIVFGMCKSYNIFAGPGASVGANPGRGHDPECWIAPIVYIWMRAAFFTVFGAIVYPIAYVQALDVDNVPAWALNRWKAAQEKSGKAIKQDPNAVPSQYNSVTAGQQPAQPMFNSNGTGTSTPAYAQPASGQTGTSGYTPTQSFRSVV